MTKRNTRQIVAVILLVLTTIFVWNRSMQSGEVSSAESGWVQSVLVAVFGPGFADTFWYTYIRKVGHFAEYTLLGIEWWAVRGAYDRRGAVRWLVWVAGTLTATVDEQVCQRLTPGRGPQWTDVLLDSAGYATGLLLAVAVTALWRCLKKRREKCIK